MKTTDILLGKINTFLNKILKRNFVIPNLDGYTLVKDLTPSYTSRINRIGIYTNSKSQKVVIKRVSYGFRDLDAIYNSNEADLLRIFSELKTDRKIFPAFVEKITKPHITGFITKYSAGEILERSDKLFQWEVAKNTFYSLQNLSEELDQKNVLGHISTRKPLSYLISFLPSVCRLILKNPRWTMRYIGLSFLFYTLYLPSFWKKFAFGLVHRDLYPDNILYDKKTGKITITDWESTVVSDSLYDLAQITMIYSSVANLDDIAIFLNTALKTNAEKKRYIALSIFNSIQMLSHTDKKHPVFADIQRFLERLIISIKPRILYKKSLFEIVLGTLLTCTYYFYKVTKLPFYNRSKKLILCYHSIGKNGWRYSIDTDVFAQQLEFLQKNYSIVSLSELMSQNTGGVSITFDDGYKNILENALPLLENAKLTAAMFALGDEKNPNREELDNALEMLTKNDLLLLKQKGWEIGSHTLTHANLGSISDERLDHEIIQSKKMLEKNLGFPVRYLAYPKGIYSKKIMQIAEQAGYEMAFTTDGYEASQQKKIPFGVSRILLEYSLTEKEFEALISPVGLLLSRFFVPVLQLKEMITVTAGKLAYGIKKILVTMLKRAVKPLLLVVLLGMLLAGFVKGNKVNGTFLYQHDYNRAVGGPLEASNSTARYALTEALVKDKSVFLTTDLAKFASPDVVYYNGKFTSIFTPGISFLGVPLYILGTFFGLPQLTTYLTILIFAILNVFLIIRISQKTGASYGFGLIGGIVFLFATNALVYSLTFTQHIVTVTILLLSVLNALSQRTVKNNILFGALFGIGILVDIPNVFLLLPVGLCILFRHFATSQTAQEVKVKISWKAIWIVLGVIPFVGLFGWYNFATTGSVAKFGQTIGRATNFQTPLPEQVASSSATFDDNSSKPIGLKLPFSTRAELDGMYTLLVSDERSWIYYCPVIFIGLLGLIVLYRKQETRFFSLMCLTIVGINILLYSMFTDPWGGWAFGPRYLIPSAGILCLGIGAALQRYRKNIVVLIIFTGLFVYSTWVNALGALTTSSIPPKIEATHLLAPIPWTYQYNLELLQTNFSSSLFYNLFLSHSISPAFYLRIFVGVIVCIAIVVFAITIRQGGKKK